MRTSIESLTVTKKVIKTKLPDVEALNILDLPDNDGEPMENERERIQMNLGIDLLYNHWQKRDDFYVGGNMFIYYSYAQAREVIKEINNPELPKKAFRGPDMFVVLNVDGSYRRQMWVVWEEKGRYPDVIFEFLSPSTRRIDLGKKKNLYEQTFKTDEYFCFNYLMPLSKNSLLGWRLDSQGKYQPIEPNERGWLWSQRLGLWVGKWEGTILRDKTYWMRFYTTEGELVLTEAETERLRANEKAKRADEEAKRADEETKRADEEAKRVERLIAQLKAAGIEPII
jgi:Uma2 family endonuclease